MPQSKSSSKNDAPRRDPLSRLLDPLGLVVLTRELVQEAFEDAVRRGRMTRDDAQDLAAALMSRNRQNTEDVLRVLEQLFGRHRPPSPKDARKVAGAAAAAGKEPANSEASSAGSRERRGTGSRGGPPLEGYDDLTAAQITSRLGDLTPAQLRRVRDHERRNANRKSVLQAVDRKLA